VPLNRRTMTLGKWVVAVSEPPGEGPHPVVGMMHGWKGDETSMWVFANRLPPQFLLLAPRGLYPARNGGFGWQAGVGSEQPSLADFQPAVAELANLFDAAHFTRADFDRLYLLGFSQGAALSYTFAMRLPERVKGVAGLAGFVPDDAKTLVVKRPLRGKEVFAAHGRLDEIVPVERARRGVALLEEAGAKVTFCEDEVGHKLSLNCFRGLEAFTRRWK
jgi:phospholipase/carboxylesterase